MRRNAAFAALLSLAACGGGDGGTPAPSPAPTPTPTPTPTNQPPSFTSSATASVAENIASAYQATATDPDGNALTFSISGGADASRFSITSAGALTFTAAPDFEVPADADANNIYLVQLKVSDGQASATLDLQVTVTNDREGIRVRRVGSGFDQPVFVAPIPGDSRVLVVEKTGDIFRLDPATGAKTTFLSLVVSTDSERGLLAVAAAPDYQSSGDFFVYLTDAGGDIEIRRYRRGSNGLGNPNSGEVLLHIEHSQRSNHNGGWLGFGPDGALYIATGDGGGAGDPDDNAQNTNRLLGKILRLMRNPSATGRSWIADNRNPFFGGGGAPEIFAYGLRNPFRNSFYNDELLIGDVGQDAVEEVDRLRIVDAGANLGWPYREGSHSYRGTAPSGLTGPVTEYPHGSGPREGDTVIGGYVYRGPAAALANRYLFADFISGNIWSVPIGQLQRGQLLPASRYERRNPDFTPDAGTIDQPVSFGEDSAGNLYIVDYDGEIFQIGAG